MTIIIINPIDGPIIPYAAVLYQTDSPITDNMHALCHGNSKGNQSRPYIRSSKEVLSKTKNLLKEGNTCKEAYDKVNALSGFMNEFMNLPLKAMSLETLNNFTDKRRNETKNKTCKFI